MDADRSRSPGAFSIADLKGAVLRGLGDSDSSLTSSTAFAVLSIHMSGVLRRSVPVGISRRDNVEHELLSLRALIRYYP